MQRILLPSLLAIGLFGSPSPGQLAPPPPIGGEKVKDTKKKETPKAPAAEPAPVIPGEVDVHFLNGSTVRMVVQSDTLEVRTLYGNLKVPVSDVRAIEFGVHFPEGAKDKIKAAIKNLSSNNYQDREDASKTLVDLGPFSFPATQEASREKDAEISRRAQDVVKKLQAKFPKSDLKSSTDDKVVTATFTIVGEILTPTIKAKTEYFGEVELSLAKMRNLRAVGGPSLEVVVSVDATKYANAGQWMDTKYRTDGRAAIAITAKGVVDTMPNDPGNYLVGPNGGNHMRGGRGMVGPGTQRKIVGPINPQIHGGMLIGKIGEDGEAFIIGESFEGAAEQEGTLFLHIGPSPFHCPSAGAFEVKITRKS